MRTVPGATRRDHVPEEGEGMHLTQRATAGLQGPCKKVVPRIGHVRGEWSPTPHATRPAQASADIATDNSPATRALSLSSATFDFTTSPPVTMRM